MISSFSASPRPVSSRSMILLNRRFSNAADRDLVPPKACGRQTSVAKSLAPVTLEAILWELATDEGMTETGRDRALELVGELAKERRADRAALNTRKNERN